MYFSVMAYMTNLDLQLVDKKVILQDKYLVILLDMNPLQ